MSNVKLNIPDEILISLKVTKDEIAKDILLFAAVKMYQMGKLSSGRAAQLAGIPRVSFLQTLSKFNVPIFSHSYSELSQDLKNA